MNVKDSISATMDAIEGNESGDQSAKNIFSYKPIMGNILMYTVAEYRNCISGRGYGSNHPWRKNRNQCHR